MRSLLALVALLALASASRAARLDGFDTELVAEINALRVDQGLAPLVVDPALSAVATERTAAMARDGWFGFESPDGVSIETALDRAAIPFRLVTEKLVRSPESPKEIGAAWRLRPASNRNSLLHPDVRVVGIGVAESGVEHLVEIVLVEPFDAAAAAPPAVDVERERPALRARIDARRGELGRAPLRADPVLEAATQQHAEAYLEALAAGRGSETIATLDDRIVDLDRRHRGAHSGSASSKDAFMLREVHAQSGDRRPVGDSEVFSVVIGDARDADGALEILESERADPYCLDAAMRAIGVGLAAGPTPEGERVVWVVAVRRR